MTRPRADGDGETDRPLRIGEVAAAFGIHPQTLRFYEREGLLRPARTGGNTRRYRCSDLVTLARILDLTRHEGINLSAAKRILELEQRTASLERDNDRLRCKLSRQQKNARSDRCKARSSRTSGTDDVIYCRPSGGV